MDQRECIQIELFADKHLNQASEKNWVKTWLQSPILNEKVEPFTINLSTFNLAEKGFSILLHSFAKQ